MSTVDGRNAVARPADVAARPRPFPVWVLQVTELIVAVVFVDVSVHVSGGGLLVAAAVAFAALAITAEGSLGLLRIWPPRLHIALVVAVAALVAATPVLPALRPDIEGIIVLEFGAIGLIRVATLTRTSERPRAAGTRRGSQRVIDTTASVVDPGDPVAPGPPPTPPGPAGAGAARRAGRTAGAAATAGKRLVATHRPAAEAHLKRSIRRVGRWAGRLTSPPDDREPPAQ
jgi:hypothetical protein